MPDAEQIRRVVEKQLAEELTKVPKFDQDWITAGLDSLEVIDVLLKLEKEFGHQIPVEQFSEEMTTEHLVVFLHQHLNS